MRACWATAGFVAQFGISGDPKAMDVWRDKKLKDDPVKVSSRFISVFNGVRRCLLEFPRNGLKGTGWEAKVLRARLIPK
jgi:hypothetical protein